MILINHHVPLQISQRNLPLRDLYLVPSSGSQGTVNLHLLLLRTATWISQTGPSDIFVDFLEYGVHGCNGYQDGGTHAPARTIMSVRLWETDLKMFCHRMLVPMMNRPLFCFFFFFLLCSVSWTDLFYARHLMAGILRHIGSFPFFLDSCGSAGWFFFNFLLEKEWKMPFCPSLWMLPNLLVSSGPCNPHQRIYQLLRLFFFTFSYMAQGGCVRYSPSVLRKTIWHAIFTGQCYNWRSQIWEWIPLFIFFFPVINQADEGSKTKTVWSSLLRQYMDLLLINRIRPSWTYG